jgi:hypothetical protein
MDWTGKLLGAIAAIVVAMGIAPVQAVTLNTGGTATYNFDFTGHSPAPPFGLAVNTFFGLTGVDAGDAATFRWFDGLGGTGAHIKTDVDDPLSDYVGPFGSEEGEFSFNSQDGIRDGVFSVVVTADHGAFNIESALAGGLNGPGLFILDVSGTLVGVTNVPEPTSLALLGGALVATMVLRRRAR